MSNNLLARNFNDVLDGNDDIIRRPVCKTPASLGYLICILPRSGSTYLTHLLRDNRHYGYPNEWFNYDSIKAIISQNDLYGFNDYLEYIWRENSSPEGIFGVQLSYPQYRCLNEIIPLEGVLGDGFKWFFLRRKNIVQQAISLYIAHNTGVYHWYCFDPDKDSRSLADIPYDNARITRFIEEILDHERKFERVFTERGVEPVRLYYEELVDNAASIMQIFREELGVDRGLLANDTKAVRRLFGGINAKFEERYRSQNRRYLEGLSMSRTLPA